MNQFQKRIFIFSVLILTLILFWWFDLGSFLTLDNLKSQQEAIQNLYKTSPAFISILYVLLYIAVTALSLPGAAILTLAGGAIFGLLWGTLLVSIASTLGATLAFLASRFILREFFEKKFSAQLKKINQGISRDGLFYLFTLRLVPIFPFFLINILMGLTAMRVIPFFLVSQIGMLPGTIVYVNAGTELSKIDSLSGLLSPALLLAFVLIGILPLVSKGIISYINSRKYLHKFKRPQSFDYNIVVIGGGSAGLVSAYIASAVKAKVALIEKHKMGGDCLNTGCVPSKAIIRSAKVAHLFRKAQEFGIRADHPQVNFSEVMQRVHNIIKKIEPHDSVERYMGLGVDCFKGNAQILSPYEVEIQNKVLKTRNIIIASGASPFVPPIPGIDKIRPLTSENLWDLKVLPKRLLVLGGGPIGSELSQAFRRLGSEVYQVEMAPRILSREDEDVSQFITEQFTRDGVQVLTSHKALRFEHNPQRLIAEHKGKTVEIPFDELILALGRRPNTQGFGLEKLGVDLTPRGTIAVDEYLRTLKYPQIFACGDVAGPYQFTHTAAHQAWFCAVNALFQPLKKFKADYRVIPWCTFVDPEVARVGMNELEAKEQNIPYRVSIYDLEDLDRAIADGDAHGFVKVLTPPGSDRILGVTIVGTHAGDYIAEFVLAMKYGLGLNKILGTIHIYPTLAEANKYAAGVWKRETAPQNLLRWVQKFHSWRRSS